LSLGEKNSAQLNNFFAFALSYHQFLGEGGGNFAFDTYISDISYKSNVFGPGTILSAEKYADFINETTNEYAQPTFHPDTSAKTGINFKPMPVVYDSKKVTFSFYNTTKKKSFKPNE
jgi:hypothetical protein